MLARRLASMPGLDVVGATCDGEAAIRDIAVLDPDVVLIDTKMKQADGLDLCRRALAAGKQATVAVLTSYLDPNERSPRTAQLRLGRAPATVSPASVERHRKSLRLI